MDPKGKVWLGLCALLFTASCQDSTPSADSSSLHAEPTEAGVIELSGEAVSSFGITVAASSWQTVQTEIQATGVVTPDPGRVAHISPLTRGRIERVLVNVGDSVRSGEPLLEYDNIELEEIVGEFLSTLAELAKRKTGMEIAEKALERAEDLLEVEGISRREYELRVAEFRDSGADFDIVTARLGQIHGKLHRFGLTDEDIAQLRSRRTERLDFPAGTTSFHHHPVSRTTLKSPFDGVILERQAAEGETVEPGDELLTLVNTTRVWVSLDIYEKDLSQIREGQSVRLQVVAYPDEVFTGTIRRIGDVLDPASRTVKAVCVVSNPGKKLKLEMFTTVSVQTGAERRILAVPSEAIQSDRQESFVYVEREDLVFQKRVILAGAEYAGYTEILGGLEPGERVIEKGAFYAKSEARKGSLGEEH